ncbi:hypothetical protein C1X35_20980 [Pseudomonas sp. FW306-1C-G01A]|nr:hypothetical protein C1X55_30765 [Pseudomonas sp. GW460-C8]PMV99181.1 hypothetical protein C1X50_30420 [Pseudomonas sp. MPR-TSA4]PMW28345.1 hypothetical protein C1X48_32270 [Pseudomonas sp. FW305-3-2-15-A-R2A1]PMW31775.1 hypothetical protein C1X49_27190 [Pseudomonas sp. MPR-E5]PMW52485.1 hypothetical protein C1X39_28900 [Pseudomonas sp. GW456-12-1-14-TSB1]PMW71914.1 hypothetical protein C1X36_30950 [Pseudomonas sp. GW460-8]PMW79935.1 hypothetical protein C1X35_20980 [Pseudomonas sp. FW306-
MGICSPDHLFSQSKTCGGGACSRLSAQHSQKSVALPRFWGRYAAQREQAPSPQKQVGLKNRA